MHSWNFYIHINVLLTEQQHIMIHSTESAEGKTTTRPEKLPAFNGEKFHYTFILWHHEFIPPTVSYCSVIIASSRDVYMAPTEQHQPANGNELCTNLHVTIICV